MYSSVRSGLVRSLIKTKSEISRKWMRIFHFCQCAFTERLRGKEIDRQNIESMINILKRDFSENQIIIASIFEYNLPDMHKINIVNRLIEEDDSLNT